MSYKRDLAAVSFPYREPLRAFCEDGKNPKQRVVLAVLAGDTVDALKLAKDQRDLVAIYTFLENHMSPTAWGSPLKMARWEIMASARCEGCEG